MNIFKATLKTISLSASFSALSLLSQRYLPKHPIRSPCFHFHRRKELHFDLVEVPRSFHYEQYLKNLKSLSWVNYKIDCLKKLLEKTRQVKNNDFKHIRSLINEILILSKQITDARSYHHTLDIDISAAIKHSSYLLMLTFTKNANLTHQNIIEEQSEAYEFIQFGTYFDLCASWKVLPQSNVLEYYMHSYMNLLFDRNLLRYILAYEAIRQSEDNEVVRDIIEKSVMGIGSMIRRLDSKIEEEGILNPYEMGVYLKHIRNEVNKRQNEDQRQSMIRMLGKYVKKSPVSWGRTELHCENMVYCLYLLLQQDDQGILFELYDWMCEQFILSRQKEDNLLQYLTILNSHQDKLTCLKVDIFLSLASDSATFPKRFDLSNQVQRIIRSIEDLNVGHWRYKYIFWLLDSLLNRYSGQSLPYIHRICSSLALVGLKSNQKISSLVIFVNELTEKYFSELSEIVQVHYSISHWLVHLPKSSLAKQKPSDLCQLLSLADRHPTLQKIYTPYLAYLLDLSLGHFLWVDLTKLYYYSIRFGVQHYSEQSKWNMEYVRRYILNEYSSMGLRRREIPQDSYFYKIIGITTPQQFYKNYLKQDH